MNVIVLMAGPSNDFEEKGYSYPKYLLEINGEPIIQRVIESLRPLDANLSFVIRKEDNDSAYIASTLNILSPECIIYQIGNVTKGATCTSLFAIDSIDNDDELLIINGDQYIKQGIPESISKFRNENLDGGVVCFHSVHPRWSYVSVDEDGYVCETSEKRPISDMATAGCYYFKHGKAFVEAAFNIICKDASYKGNYYVCSTYDELVLSQKKIGIYLIPKDDYLSFATPHLYENYLSHNKE